MKFQSSDKCAKSFLCIRLSCMKYFLCTKTLLVHRVCGYSHKRTHTMHDMTRSNTVALHATVN